MAGFTESGFERKLAELNSTQQSIQTLSLWLIHHRKHHQTIIKIWYKEFLKAQEHRKLTFIYLANDVIQNSRRKGTEFGKSFMPIIKKTLEYMARIPEAKTKESLLRILRIWAERGIYEGNLIKEFEKDYVKTWNSLHGGGGPEEEEDEIDTSEITSPTAPSTSATSSSEIKPEDGTSLSTPSPSKKLKEDKSSSKSHGKHDKKHGSSHRSSSSSSHGASKKSRHSNEKKHRSKDAEREKSAYKMRSLEVTGKVDEWEVDGVTHLQVKLSPSPYRDPPTEEEIIQLVKDLDKMPSTDAATRGKIANLPTEVSDSSKIEELSIDSDVTKSLHKKVKAAADLLTEYNEKLDKELNERKDASMKFQDFAKVQKDLLTQAEQRLEEHQNHSRIINKMIEELKDHILNMPDFSKLPTANDGLAPLPSAGDLFNI